MSRDLVVPFSCDPAQHRSQVSELFLSQRRNLDVVEVPTTEQMFH